MIKKYQNKVKYIQLHLENANPINELDSMVLRKKKTMTELDSKVEYQYLGKKTNFFQIQVANRWM